MELLKATLPVMAPRRTCQLSLTPRNVHSHTISGPRRDTMLHCACALGPMPGIPTRRPSPGSEWRRARRSALSGAGGRFHDTPPGARTRDMRRAQGAAPNQAAKAGLKPRGLPRDAAARFVMAVAANTGASGPASGRAIRRLHRELAHRTARREAAASLQATTRPSTVIGTPSSESEQPRSGISRWQGVSRLPPASVLGPVENRKLPAKQRLSMLSAASRS